MPLAYTIQEDINIPLDAFTNEVAVVFAHGGRYGGAWSISLSLSADGDSLGAIFTEENPSPDLAVDTAIEWISNHCARNDMKILKWENLNSQYGPSEAPYFALARLFIAHPAEPSA